MAVGVGVGAGAEVAGVAVAAVAGDPEPEGEGLDDRAGAAGRSGWPEQAVRTAASAASSVEAISRRGLTCMVVGPPTAPARAGP
ncbi:hypothetical protein OG311_33535 [Streptomyces sp. NBC_01343]|uniref:hypothetical protein n=1 Tax=Streptomyces sp. NBC_01343 TaxID=2903832 RepID=UPI002E0DF7BC|nr:hypothetical protein OG311_33535 [Streptomyces sp. NBC_01343]